MVNNSNVTITKSTSIFFTMRPITCVEGMVTRAQYLEQKGPCEEYLSKKVETLFHHGMHLLLAEDHEQKV
jgi:hypothetical protein